MNKLTEIPGVGPSTAQKLEQAGVNDISMVADTVVELLVQVTGFNEARAAAIRDAARKLSGPTLVVVDEPVLVDPPATAPDKGERKAQKRLQKLEKLAGKLRKKAKKAKKAGKLKRAKRASKKAKSVEKKAAKAAKKLAR